MEEHNEKECYCRMLGHHVKFPYCCQVNENLPCSAILDCWNEIFPVEKYIQDNYSQEELEKIFTQPKTKIETILSIVQKIKSDS